MDESKALKYLVLDAEKMDRQITVLFLELAIRLALDVVKEESTKREIAKEYG